VAETPPPFEIKECSLTFLAMGKSALNLRELRDHVAGVPDGSLLHHFHDALLRPAFDDPQYPNDFAQWARSALHDEILAERFGMVDPMEFTEPEGLRERLVDLIEDRLSETPGVPSAIRGEEFHFLKSQFVILDTGNRANDPDELGRKIPEMSTGSIFFHFVEARRREPVNRDDFSLWIESWGERYEDLARSLVAIDFHSWSLKDMKARIAATFADHAGARS